jgi:hypothetical protein
LMVAILRHEKKGRVLLSVKPSRERAI